jgi:NTP pyrophosphatase (non-canonical NTP hydrolase)
MTERILGNEPFALGDDMALDELGAWGEAFATKIAAKHGLEPDDPQLAHMQLNKLHKEVAEIGEELLLEAGQNFAAKDDLYSRENEEKEFADAMLALAVLAAMRKVNLARVTRNKMEEINRRSL